MVCSVVNGNISQGVGEDRSFLCKALCSTAVPSLSQDGFYSQWLKIAFVHLVVLLQLSLWMDGVLDRLSDLL